MARGEGSENPARQALRRRAQALMARRQQLDSEIDDLVLKDLKLGLEDLFRGWPQLESIGWTHRQSEYNDEGPYPGVNVIWFQWDGEEYDLGWGGGYDISGGSKLDKDQRQEVCRGLAEVIENHSEPSLFRLFGEESLLQATRQGIASHEFDYYEEDPIELLRRNLDS